MLFTPKLCRGEQAIGGTTSRQFPVYCTIIFSCWYIPLRATRYISLSKQHSLACTHTCVQQCVKKTDVIDFFLFFSFFRRLGNLSYTRNAHTHTQPGCFAFIQFDQPSAHCSPPMVNRQPQTAAAAAHKRH